MNTASNSWGLQLAPFLAGIKLEWFRTLYSWFEHCQIIVVPFIFLYLLDVHAPPVKVIEHVIETIYGTQSQLAPSLWCSLGDDAREHLVVREHTRSP